MDLTQETLLEMLEDAAPTRLLCVAPAPPASVKHWATHGADRQVEHVAPAGALEALGGLGRFDYAFVTDALASLDVSEGMALLARLRDLHCHRFAVTHRHAPAEDDPWTDGRFLSLTLALHRRITEGDGIETSVYAYDIDTYNRRREWNSPEDWANPQNFHRWRW
jgi:hypothetical protein